MERPRVRFAPSPTGFFHVGSARTALFNWLFAASRRARSSFASRTPTRSGTGSSGSRDPRAMDWLGDAARRRALLQPERSERHGGHELLWAGGTSTRAIAPARQWTTRTKGNPIPGYDGFCRDRGLPAVGPDRLALPNPRRRRDVVPT